MVDADIRSLEAGTSEAAPGRTASRRGDRAGPEPRRARTPGPPVRALQWLATFVGRRWGGLTVITAFALSRVALAHLADLRFDNIPLNVSLQLLDRGHLREDLVGSVIHLHSQPPLFNLLIGLGLRAPLHLETPLFHALYLAVGLGTTVCLYALLRRVGVPTVVAVVVTLVFTSSPSFFLYETWLHYDQLVMFLLCLSALALLRYEESGRARHAAVFLTLVAAVVLTRSLFHLVWFMAWPVVLLARRGVDRRRLLSAMALPVVVVVGLQVHRLVTFGTPSLSSLVGISLAKITTFQLSESERRDLVGRGEISPVSLVEPLSPPASYEGLVPTPRPTGVPALDEDLKGFYRSPLTDDFFRMNLNSMVFLEVSNQYRNDALHVIRTRPGAYVKGVARAVEIFFRPTSDVFAFAQNRDRVGSLDRFYNRAVFGVAAPGKAAEGIPPAHLGYIEGPARTAWFVVAAYVAALVGGAFTLLRRARRRDEGGGSLLTIGFLWLTTLYVFVFSNTLEVGENNRFRLYSDPLVIALLAALVVRWHRGRAERIDARPLDRRRQSQKWVR